MANILYYTRTDFVPANNNAGGMGTKTRAMMEAWTDHNITVSDSLAPPSPTHLPPQEQMQAQQFDVIIIELMGLLNPREKLQERIDELKNYDAPKLVYGSDSEIFRWKGKELEMLKPIVTGWNYANCVWQRNYFMDFDLPVFGIVYEPIDTDMFRPSENPEKIIFTGGRISHQKEAEFFIELFSELKEHKKDYKTAYIGSAGGWNDFKPQNLKLEHTLKSVTDMFHGQVEQSKVSSIIGKGAVAVFNPKYETCHRLGMEASSSGKARVCGKHILYDEKITSARFDSVKSCIKELGELTEGFTELPPAEHGKKAREFALNNYSYKATQEQLNTFLGYVL